MEPEFLSKPFFVFMTHCKGRLGGEKPCGGKVRYFANLSEAQSCAVDEKDDWSWVDVYERRAGEAEDGLFDRRECYRNGKKEEVF